MGSEAQGSKGRREEQHAKGGASAQGTHRGSHGRGRRYNQQPQWGGYQKGGGWRGGKGGGYQKGGGQQGGWSGWGGGYQKGGGHRY